MGVSALPDISQALVSPTNPARNDGQMDYERCAALQNYLAQYAWIASDKSFHDVQHQSFFDYYGEEAEQLRGRFHPSFAAFLESIIITNDYNPFFYWVGDFVEPHTMFQNEEMFPDEEPDRFVVLYETNIWHAEHNLGLVYDQKRHRASLLLDIMDTEYALPAEKHEDLWHPLETVLSNWITMIQVGKITVSPDGSSNSEYKPWTWHSYSASQVDSTVTAFNRLTEAIERRMPTNALLPPFDGPLLNREELDVGLVLEDSFIWKVLSRVRKPRFRNIAPGLIVPLDAAAFASSQKFTRMDTSGDDTLIVPPVLIFMEAEGKPANFDPPSRYQSRIPFPLPFRREISPGDRSIPAGLYSESVDRAAGDSAEEGFRLILPFVPGEVYTYDSGLGPRKSDGSKLESESISDLFQHGFKPFGGDPYRPQRLERLLDRWRELVESGTWSVGDNGVEGTIERFRCDTRWSWRENWIPPDW